MPRLTSVQNFVDIPSLLISAIMAVLKSFASFPATPILPGETLRPGVCHGSQKEERWLVERVGLASSLSSGMLLLRAPARAQDAGIAGVVKDTSGGVLPGATVTAASPAFIEQQRTRLPTGRGDTTSASCGLASTRHVHLPGFRTVVREGIQLSAGFTANVDAEMRVGSIAETITVTGASPVVDARTSGGRRW